MKGKKIQICNKCDEQGYAVFIGKHSFRFCCEKGFDDTVIALLKMMLNKVPKDEQIKETKIT